jgi:hypothetical protein
MRLTENQLKSIIRDVIYESSFKSSEEDYQYTCNFTSNGFIDTEGNWIKIPDRLHHDDYIGFVKRRDILDGKDITHYDSWIKVSNSRYIKIRDYSILRKQIPGLIDMWLTCAKYSPWIFESYSGGTEKFTEISTDDEILIDQTIEDFLIKYAPDLVNSFFSKLSDIL